MTFKTSNFNMRMEAQKKADVESLFQSLGMTLPQAVNMFFTQSLLVGGLPFDVKLPRYNRETEAAMQEARNIASGKIEARTYSDWSEFKDEMDREC